MGSNFHFRAVLLRVQELLSEDDRTRLHFLLGEDVPRSLRDDSSIGGALRVFENLIEQTFIDEQDCDYLIEAFETVRCHGAAERLRGQLPSRFHLTAAVYTVQSTNVLNNVAIDPICR